MHRGLLVVAAGLLVLGASCGDDDAPTSGSDDETTTSAPAETTTTAGPASTTTAPASTTTVTVDSGLPTDPEGYAIAFVEAWEQGDQDRALELGTQAAVDSIFAFESGGVGTWSLQQCEGAAGSSYCTFTAGGDPTIVVRVGNDAVAQGAIQAVTEVQAEG